MIDGLIVAWHVGPGHLQGNLLQKFAVIVGTAIALQKSRQGGFGFTEEKEVAEFGQRFGIQHDRDTAGHHEG